MFTDENASKDSAQFTQLFKALCFLGLLDDTERGMKLLRGDVHLKDNVSFLHRVIDLVSTQQHLKVADSTTTPQSDLNVHNHLRFLSMLTNNTSTLFISCTFKICVSST